jgi:Xaa-Pro dipeptidase
LQHLVGSIDVEAVTTPGVALWLEKSDRRQNPRGGLLATSLEAKRAFRVMEEARGIAFRMIRHGVACGVLDSSVNEFLRAEGYTGEECRLYRTVHGIGLGNHAPPWVAEGSTDVLAENMVISVEPGIYLKGEGGFRHSDTVLVTREGCECLTQCTSDIGSLTIRRLKAGGPGQGRLDPTGPEVG